MARLNSLIIDDTGNLNVPVGTIDQQPSVTRTVVNFTTVGTTAWTAPANVTSIEVLVVAGGGSGGGGNVTSGGGGAGGLIYRSDYPVTAGQSYAVTVGAGGSNTNGSNSLFDSLIANGGGRGGTNSTSGSDGGSGGGSGHGTDNNLFRSGGKGIAGQGFGGGGSPGAPNYPAGGGGGAGGPGETPANSQSPGGNGGPGLQFAISGTPTFYAGGGGAGIYSELSGGQGGVGGGGNGGGSIGGLGAQAATAGTANTGGGGGGASGNTSNWAPGGSGIVVIRYTVAGTENPTGRTRWNSTLGTLESFSSKSKWTDDNNDKNIVSNGLIFHLDANKYGTGSTWYDLSGTNINGNIEGATYNSDYQGSFVFDGTNDRVTGNTSSFNFGSNNFTLAFWVRTNDISDVDNKIIHFNRSGSDAVFQFRRGNAGGSPGKRLLIQTNVAGTWNTAATTTDVFVDNSWLYVVAVKIGTAIRFYVNGALLDTTGSVHATLASSANNNFFIGSRVANANEFWNGNIAVAKIYNRALSGEEVIQNFNAYASRFSRSNIRIFQSAQEVLSYNPNAEAGVYWINIPSIGPKPVWCEFINGEGWMLAANIKSDYYGTIDWTWADNTSWRREGNNIGRVDNPYKNIGQFRDRDIYSKYPADKVCIKIHNKGNFVYGGKETWVSYEILPSYKGRTMLGLLTSGGGSGGGLQVSSSWYAQSGMATGGTSGATTGVASGLEYCPIARSVGPSGHLRVNHFLNNNGVRLLASFQNLETTNTDRTRGLGIEMCMDGSIEGAGVAGCRYNGHWHAWVNDPVASPHSSGQYQYGSGQFPDGSNANAAGAPTPYTGPAYHYGILVK